jgi:dienelactone hydrolase
VVDSALRLNPDYAAKGVALLRERSVMNWPEQVSAPVLIIHGAADQEVPAVEAMAFATKLAQRAKPYELIVYAGDTRRPITGRIGMPGSSPGSNNTPVDLTPPVRLW